MLDGLRGEESIAALCQPPENSSKLLKKQGMAPRVMITDKLASYGAAKREIMPGVEHRQHKGLNNRAENSHQPTRRRERIMKRFKSAKSSTRSRTSFAVPLTPPPLITACPEFTPFKSVRSNRRSPCL